MERFLNETTAFASLMEERFDASVRNDNLVYVVVKVAPNPAPVADADAARVLEACDVNCRFPILSRSRYGVLLSILNSNF